MGQLSNLLNKNTMSGGMSYFDYEVATGRDILIPWLSKHINLKGLRVGDFGCHQGGVLHALREYGGIESGMGFDLNAASIESSPFRNDDKFRIQVGDVTRVDPAEYRFDLILIRDVLEHIPDFEQALRRAHECLTPEGLLFISYPPYYSAFGGHQQMASNWTRCAPFLHYLPAPVFFSLVKTEDDVYMTADSTMEDIQSVQRTRLTLGKTEKTLKGMDYIILAQEYFLSRPEFKIRYGLPTVSGNFLEYFGPLREILTMGIYYLVRRERRTSER